jgi:hypothetical protein
MRIEEERLGKWDEFADSLGLSRTACIKQAMNVFMLFMNDKLTSSNKNDISDLSHKIENLKEMISGLETKETIYQQEIDDEIEKVQQYDPEDIKDYDKIRDDILERLENWGDLTEEVLKRHLADKYPSYLIWIVLMKLKQDNLVRVKDGEWGLV